MAQIRSRRKSLSDTMLKLLFEKKYGGQTKAAMRLANKQHYLNAPPPSMHAYQTAPEIAILGQALQGISRDYHTGKAWDAQQVQNRQYTAGLEGEQQAIQNAQEQDYQGDIARDMRDFGLKKQQADQKHQYMNSMIGLKREALKQKAAAAMAKSAGQGGGSADAFKGDPQAKSIWRGLKSIEDKRAFEKMYQLDRDAALDALEDVAKPKSFSNLFGLTGNKEPSGNYKVSKNPMKDNSAVMTYDQYAKEIMSRAGDVPEGEIRQGYEVYLRSYGMSESSIKPPKPKAARSLGGI